MEIFQEWLRNNGYRFEVNQVGITFKHQGDTFIIADNSGDEQFLQIIMPMVCRLNDFDEKQNAFDACNKLTSSIKCLKAFVIDGDSVWLSTEIFIDHTPELDDFMERLLDILQEGRMKLKKML